MSITIDAPDAALVGFYTAAMLAMLAIGWLSGLLYSYSRLAAAQAVMRRIAEWEAEAASPPEPPKVAARTRFQLRPGEFPLLRENPLVPLLTRPKPARKPYTDRVLVIHTRHGKFAGAEFAAC